MHMGIINKKAPELRVAHWIDANGTLRTPLKLSDLGGGYKVLYCFQHWCPGCHSRGFPTLKRLVEALSEKGFGFTAIQTVFEGEDSNTPDKLREEQKRYGLKLPFGHDVSENSDRYPSVMEDYRTGGTPWFIVIDPANHVIFNDFRLDADRFLGSLDREAVSIA